MKSSVCLLVVARYRLLTMQLKTANCRFRPPTDWFQVKITFRVRFRVTLRLVVYRQSVHFGAKPVEAHDLGTERIKASLPLFFVNIYCRGNVYRAVA
jgi:hypothetical protein